MVDNVKSCSQEKVEMLAMMLHRSLPMSVGNSEAFISRHIDAIGTRFR